MKAPASNGIMAGDVPFFMSEEIEINGIGISRERRGGMKAFPKKIYAQWQKSTGSEPYLDVGTTIEFIDEHMGKVAIYELKEVKTLKVTRELE
jgi:hypothetical protein